MLNGAEDFVQRAESARQCTSLLPGDRRDNCYLRFAGESTSITIPGEQRPGLWSENSECQRGEERVDPARGAAEALC